MSTQLATHERVATRAYFLWEAAGRPDGQHEAHWLAAALAEHRLANEAATHRKRSEAAKRGAATKRARTIRVSRSAEHAGAVH